VDQRIIELFDRYTHGGLTRRAFLDRLAAIAGGAAAATALLPLLENNYARAETIPESDPRLVAEMIDIPGSAPGLKGYLAKPKQGQKFPAVIVVHENRGFNPHIKDIARRLAVAGFAAVGIDYLSPLGGTPTDEDKARDMINGCLIGEAHHLEKAEELLRHGYVEAPPIGQALDKPLLVDPADLARLR
jgi:carboxymethylenebutenolidase